MTTTRSYKIADKLYLVHRTLGGDAPPAAPPAAIPTDNVFIYDCSGSMYSNLPPMRQQLKTKMPGFVGEQDTVSMIWFSGRGQFGTLMEGEPIHTLKDLSNVNKTIDRYLQPQGSTGFKEPIEESVRLVERLAKKRPSALRRLMFLSDGCENSWPRNEVLKAVEKAAGSFTETVIVEYGNYADRAFLAQMAEKFGGAHIFAENFTKYEGQFEAVITKKAQGGKRIEVKVEGDPIGGFAYALHDGDLITYGIEGGKAILPEKLHQFYYVSPTPVGTVENDTATFAKNASTGHTPSPAVIDASYAAISLFAVRMKPEVVLPFLKLTGDVNFIEQFSGCFGKQKYSEFMDSAKHAAFGTVKRWSKGYDPNKVPREDAFTVLDLLNLLAGDDKNKVFADPPLFDYERIGRARVDASENFSVKEQEELEELKTQVAKAKKPAEITDLNTKIAALTAKKRPSLKFEANPAPDGYSVCSLVFNEDRPNISILINRQGVVDVSSRIPDEHKAAFKDTKVKTKTFRAYSIIADGIINVDELPVRLSPTTRTTLEAEVAAGRLSSEVFADKNGVTYLQLRKVPVINRKMIKAISAKSFFETGWELTKAQAAQKVFNSYAKDLLPPAKIEGFTALYGEAAAKWLKEECGISDSGFSPKSVKNSEEATDFYMAKELKVSLTGYSSIPSLNEFKKQAAKGKLAPPAQLMEATVKECDAFLASDEYKNAADQKAFLKLWLDKRTSASKDKCRNFIFDIATATFCVVVGQTWFKEFSSLDENELTIKVDGKDITCKAEQREVRVDL